MPKNQLREVRVAECKQLLFLVNGHFNATVYLH